MSKLVAPFPYCGGKRRYTKQIWEALGDPQAYVEPFCGSAAVLLNRPESSKPRRRELINDNMGWVVNFFRAVKTEPEKVAGWMDWPVTQPDYAARQQWLDTDLGPELQSDPDFFDVRAAGVWAWGVSASIGNIYPSGSVNQQPYTKSYQGSNQRQPAEQPYTNHYRGSSQRHKNLYEWCQQLADRLRYVQIHYGNWELCLRKSAHKDSGHTVGVFLDPPYNPTKANTSMYQHGDTWQAAWEWALSKGNDPQYHIIICGYEGSYPETEGWTFQPLGNVGKGNVNKRRKEGMWLSPHCEQTTQTQTLKLV